MEITTSIDSPSATITLVGELTVETASDLEAAFAELPEDVTDITLDLSELDYVASAGLRVMVSQAKKTTGNGGSFRLTHPNDDVAEVLEITGLDNILEVVQWRIQGASRRGVLDEPRGH